MSRTELPYARRDRDRDREYDARGRGPDGGRPHWDQGGGSCDPRDHPRRRSDNYQLHHLDEPLREGEGTCRPHDRDGKAPPNGGGYPSSHASAPRGGRCDRQVGCDRRSGHKGQSRHNEQGGRDGPGSYDGRDFNVRGPQCIGGGQPHSNTRRAPTNMSTHPTPPPPAHPGRMTLQRDSAVSFSSSPPDGSISVIRVGSSRGGMAPLMIHNHTPPSSVVHSLDAQVTVCASSVAPHLPPTRPLSLHSFLPVLHVNRAVLRRGYHSLYSVVQAHRRPPACGGAVSPAGRGVAADGKRAHRASRQAPHLRRRHHRHRQPVRTLMLHTDYKRLLHRSLPPTPCSRCTSI
jgi:hypothetical protein